MYHVKTNRRRVEGPLNYSQYKILDFMEENPRIKRIDMAYKLGITFDGIRYNMKKLKSSGIVVRIYDNEGGYWKVDRTKIALLDEK